MSRRIFSFDPPDRFLCGTVGAPGHRTFFLQATKGGAVVSVALEKQQVALLADRIGALLDELGRRGVELPPVTLGAVDDAPLVEPVDEQFRVGTLTLAWDAERRVVMIEARELTDDEDDDEDDEDAEAPVPFLDESPEGPDLLRIRLDPLDARVFAQRAERVVAAGRPPCPLCGQPLDPQGHLCPRRNGYVH
jgi:uncharacterized repeat protein (TIGR03847 family)